MAATVDETLATTPSMPWKKKIVKFVKKYFLEGQKLEKKVVVHVPDGAKIRERILIKYRRELGLLIPFVFFQTIWWCLAIRHNFFQYFPDKYLMGVTMVFGALIAGATSEGGGAVAFPVMTLVLKVQPKVARDFSMMIQSCGMTAASFAIVFMRIKLEYNSLVFCSTGGTLGLIIGSHFIDPYITPPYKKMLFVSLTFSFAVVLFILNRKKKRTTFDSIQNMNLWKAGVLLLSGFAGGTLTAFSGSGLDICSFSFLTLLFSVSEKVATPTSVVLMAINSIVGAFWRNYMINPAGLLQEAWEYMAICVPIVTFCAPFGSMVASHFHRQVLAFMVYILETVSLLSGFIFVRPEKVLAGISVGLVVAGSVFFFCLSRLGERLMNKELKNSSETSVESSKSEGSGVMNSCETQTSLDTLESADSQHWLKRDSIGTVSALSKPDVEQFKETTIYLNSN